MNLTEQWVEDGLVVARGVYDRERAGKLLTICDRILDQWFRCNPENGQAGGGANATCMRHLNHPGYFLDHPDEKTCLLDAVADPGILGIARSIMGEEPLFRCTSYFFDPEEEVGDGNWHRDSQFGTPDDEAEKKAIADRGVNGSGIQMQIALVASDDVEYVPGSHKRWDTPEEYHIRKADRQSHNRSNDMPGAVRVALEPGDAVLFNAMGLHRGRYHRDRKRRTLMLTFTKSSTPYRDYFSKQPWMLESGYLEGVQKTTEDFFNAFTATYASWWLEESGQ